jgi:hypothetical protein
MKKQLLLLAIFSLQTAFSQTPEMNLIPIQGGRTAVNQDIVAVKKYPSHEILGSLYIDDNFYSASINNTEKLHLFRYNAYTDEIEFKNDKEKLFYLNKTAGKLVIDFVSPRKTYELVEYINPEKEKTLGYLVLIFEDVLTLYKREKIIFKKEEIPKNGYFEYKHNRYERDKDIFFIKLKNENIIIFPKNKKEYLSLFPEHKKELEEYFKNNNISFKNESDVIKLHIFTNELMKSN